MSVYKTETHKDRRLGRSQGASSGSLSSWLFCSILQGTHITQLYASCLYMMKCLYWMCVHMRERECNEQDKKFHSEGNLTQEGKGQWKLEEKQRVKGRAEEKESLPGWAADVILKRLEQKWGGSGKQTIDLSLYSPSLAFSIYLTLFLQFYCDRST